MEIQNTNMKAMPAELKKVWGLRLAGAGVAVGGIALLSPVIWGAVVGGAGLIVGGVVALIGVGLFQALPLIGQKWENKLLSMRKAEARANPIEQLQNFLLSKKASVNSFKNAVIGIGTQIKSMEDMLADRIRTKPTYDGSKQKAAIEAMQKAHHVLKIRYEDAEQALRELQDVIEDKKFEYKFGEEGQKAINSLNATSGQELLDEMLADEAFSAVRDKFNTVFAALEMEAIKLNKGQQLTFDDGMTIDISGIKIPVGQELRSL